MALERKSHVNSQERGAATDQLGGRAVVCGGGVSGGSTVRKKSQAVRAQRQRRGKDPIGAWHAYLRPPSGYDATGAGRTMGHCRTHTGSVALHTRTPARTPRPVSIHSGHFFRLPLDPSGLILAPSSHHLAFPCRLGSFISTPFRFLSSSFSITLTLFSSLPHLLTSKHGQRWYQRFR